jgi:small subunit ribosomal protein S20
VPNTKSAIKMVRVAERRRLRNRPIRSSVKTFVRKAEHAIVGSGDEAVSAVVAAIRALDKAVNKGVIHRNNAARRKSRLMKKLNRATGVGKVATT